MLASGSRDKSILLRDVRLPDHYTDKLQGHRSEICGLKVGSMREGGNEKAVGRQRRLACNNTAWQAAGVSCMQLRPVQKSSTCHAMSARSRCVTVMSCTQGGRLPQAAQGSSTTS